MSYFIYGNKIFNCGEVGISVSGVNDVYIGNNKIFDTPIGIKLTDCQTANVKSNEGTRVKTLVHINETSKSVVKEKIATTSDMKLCLIKDQRASKFRSSIKK